MLMMLSAITAHSPVPCGGGGLVLCYITYVPFDLAYMYM